MEKADVEQLKAYVRSNETGMNRADSTIVMSVSHSGLKITHFMEIRFDLYMTVSAVKTKLCTMCGTSPSAMLLQLRDERGGVLATLGDDAKMLGFYSPYEGCTLHVIDTDPASLAAGGWLEDVSKVEKYVISDDDYNKRENTYRKFKEAKIAADPEWTLEKEICIRKGIPYVPPPAAISDAEYMQAEASGIQARGRLACARPPPPPAAPLRRGGGGRGAGRRTRAAHSPSRQRPLAARPPPPPPAGYPLPAAAHTLRLPCSPLPPEPAATLPPPPPLVAPKKTQNKTRQVGARCSVDPGDRRGEVKFVGNGIVGLPLGYWVGILYDEPLGKNDGSVKGRRIFDAPPGYGAFVRPDKVVVGDFPVIDEFASDDEI